MMPNKGFHIPADPKRVALEQRQKRQADRKAKPEVSSIDEVYNMLSDVIDNQEWIIEQLKKK